MQQTNGSHALRVAGRYAKDMLKRPKAWYKGPTDQETTAWLNEHHPWAIPMIDQAVAEALAEYRAQQGEEAGRE